MSDPVVKMLTRMAQNNAWANYRVYTTLSGMSDDDFAAARPGFLGSLKATLNHIHQVDLYYLDALENGGLGRTVYLADEFAAVSDLAAAQRQCDARLIDLCVALRPDQLDETRQTERKDGTCNERVGALLPHLFQHQIHHRGQVHGLLSQTDVAPPQLDEFYMAWDWDADRRAPDFAELGWDEAQIWGGR